MTGYDYIDHLPTDFTSAGLRADVRSGLLIDPKSLPPKWFYDKTGSALFEEITRLPEYYPTRAERAILEHSATEILARSGARTVVELGSGSSEKTRLLLDALPTDDAAYVALDVSETALRQACESVAADYPALRVTAVRADFEHQLSAVLGSGSRSDEGSTAEGSPAQNALGGRPPAGTRSVAGIPGAGVPVAGAPAVGGRMLAFLGGTIGNLAPEQRRRFLAEVRAGLGAGDSFLLGADLVKSPTVLVPAYDDAAGVTAAFNLNVLEVLNRQLAADFNREDFEHVAVWDPDEAWIEMRLRAVRPVRVWIADLEVEVRVAAGEEIRTEISAKFTHDRLRAEFAAAGFSPAGWWTDSEDRFSLSLWMPV